jgi:hypothetical protein
MKILASLDRFLIRIKAFKNSYKKILAYGFLFMGWRRLCPVDPTNSILCFKNPLREHRSQVGVVTAGRWAMRTPKANDRYFEGRSVTWSRCEWWQQECPSYRFPLPQRNFPFQVLKIEDMRRRPPRTKGVMIRTDLSTKSSDSLVVASTKYHVI